MKATRRDALKAALALPAVASLPSAARARSGTPVLVHDAALAAGRHMAKAHAGPILAIEGDRIRFARALFERRPSLVVGVSRHADALLIADVGREAGYRLARSGAALQEIMAGFETLDRGLVVGWVLAPRD